uniref:Uncharacterized protein n=1 Tax=Arundo donax TaxID=35708 RepID=A0A0A9HG98_ARUDO
MKDLIYNISNINWGVEQIHQIFLRGHVSLNCTYLTRDLLTKAKQNFNSIS